MSGLQNFIMKAVLRINAERWLLGIKKGMELNKSAIKVLVYRTHE